MQSELQAGTNQILRYVTWGLLPCAGLLLWSQVDGLAWHELQHALPRVVAGVVAMVPEGLVLLTSLAFLLAARALARRSVLVQELPAVEGLARVDVVCVDKTGTITEGTIVFHAVTVLDGDAAAVHAALGALAHDEHPNATAAAIAEAFDDPGWQRSAVVAFSSARKWSAASFEGQGSWFLGAPEMLLADRPDAESVRSAASALAATGRRVLLLGSSPEIGRAHV